MKKIARVSAILIVSSAISLSSLSPHTYAASTSQPKLLIDNTEVTLNQPIELRDGTSYLPLRSIAEQLNCKVLYNSAEKKIEIIQPEMNITLIIGSKKAEVNGEKVTLNKAPYTQKGTTYVPLRFISDVMGSTIKWDQASRKITITTDIGFTLVKDESNQSNVLWLSEKDGQIWSSNGEKTSKITVTETKEWNNPKVTITPISKSIYLLDIDDEYGSSMTVFRKREQLLLNNGTVMKQTSQSYMGSYSTSEFQVNDAFNKNYLSDGNYVYEVGSNGSIAADYNLEEITGQEGPFIIEYFRDNLMFVRSYNTLQMTMIDVKKGTSDILYKKLLSKEEQAFWDESAGDTSDNLYRSSLLKLTKYENATFYFSYISTITGEKQNVSYTVK